MTPEVEHVFRSYPDEVATRLFRVRQLIYAVAKDAALGPVAESVKWGQASFVTSKGSPVRLGWSSQQPGQYSILFHCQSSLVDTFRQLFPDKLSFAGNRAIVLRVEDRDIPIEELRRCIELALNYHQLKHLPLLGNA